MTPQKTALVTGRQAVVCFFDVIHVCILYVESPLLCSVMTVNTLPFVTNRRFPVEMLLWV